MIKRRPALAALLFFAAAVFCRAQSVDVLDELTVSLSKTIDEKLPAGLSLAIFPVSGSIGIDAEGIMNYLTEQLAVQFDNFQKYEVLERQRIAAAIKEQEFQTSGNVDSKTAVEIGRLLGAQAVIVGTINGKDANRRITLRVLDVGTGKILAMAMKMF